MSFLQNKPKYSGISTFFKILLIVFIVTITFAILFFEMKDKIAPDMTLCRRAQMVRNGQELDSALEIMGQPDTIYYHDSFVKFIDIDIYIYKIPGPSSGPVRLFIKNGKVLGVSKCKE